MWYKPQLSVRANFQLERKIPLNFRLLCDNKDALSHKTIRRANWHIQLWRRALRNVFICASDTSNNTMHIFASHFAQHYRLCNALFINVLWSFVQWHFPWENYFMIPTKCTLHLIYFTSNLNSFIVFFRALPCCFTQGAIRFPYEQQPSAEEVTSIWYYKRVLSSSFPVSTS